MTKEEEYKRVCELIKYNIRAGDCGIFNNRNIIRKKYEYKSKKE